MAANTVDLLKSVNISTELAGADLGDKRRTERLLRIVAAMSCRPECSIPQIFDDDAGLEGYYRFVDNDKIRWRSILKPHADATLARAKHFDRVCVLHDTTELSFKIHDNNPMRTHLSRVTSKTQGFSLHASLCCSADGHRAPLGLLEMQPFAHKKECEQADRPEQTCAFWRAEGGLYDNEQRRWLQRILKTEESLLSQGLKGIHIGDREADDYGIVAPLLEREIDFVLRFSRKRLVKGADEPDEDLEMLTEALRSAALLGTRQVELGPRADPGHERLRKRFPKRDGRTATLEFRARQIIFPRPLSQPEDLPPQVTVWVVNALEMDPPEGEKPVRWILVTNQSCETLEQTLKVVDQYRARWLIEEFFKSLKSGQRYENLQHESAHALLNALAIKSVIAWQALVLRYFSRHYPNYPAQMVVTRVQLLILLHKKKRIFKAEKPTVHEAMMAVASLGGHIKNNGDPGWMVIMRGLKNLNDLHTGWNMAMEHAKKM